MKNLQVRKSIGLFGLFFVGMFFMFGCMGGGSPNSSPAPAVKQDSMDITTKKRLDKLKKDKVWNDEQIENARRDRMDADMKIIEALQGGSHIMMNSTYRDPEAEIKHQRWRKETADIVISKLSDENKAIDRDINRILQESQKTCFPKNTKIVMDDGRLKSIDKITAGDKIMIYDIANDQIGISSVNRNFIDKNNHLYILNDSIKATAYERFLTQDGWKRIHDISTNDSVFDGNSFVPVKSIYKIKKDLTVYNLNINSTHNFFVSYGKSDEWFLIHNCSGGGDGGGK